MRRKSLFAAEDEAWLDNDANLVDEECILEELEKASDFDKHRGQFNTFKKSIVTKLREAAGDIG